MTDFTQNIAAFYLVGGNNPSKATRCISPRMPLIETGWCAQAGEWQEEMNAHGFSRCIISNPWGRTTIDRDSDEWRPMEFDALLRARRHGMTQLADESAMRGALTALVMQGIDTTVYVGDVVRCDYIRQAHDWYQADRIAECIRPLLTSPVSIGWDAIVNLDPISNQDQWLFDLWDMLRAVKEAQGLKCYIETIPRAGKDWPGWARYPVMAGQSMVQRHMETAELLDDLTVLLQLCDPEDRNREGVIRNARFALARGWRVAIPPGWLDKYGLTLYDLCPPAPVSKPDRRRNDDAKRAGGEL